MGTKLNITQHAFTSGQASGSVEGRTDVQLLQSAAKIIINGTPIEQGPIVGRTGTEFIGEVKYRYKTTVLEEFIFARNEALVIEIGDYYFRFYVNGGLVTINSFAAGLPEDAPIFYPGDIVLYGGRNYRCIKKDDTVVDTDYATALARTRYWDLLDISEQK